MKLISTGNITNIINDELIKSDLVLVDISVSRTNKISVFVDSVKGVTIEECQRISRIIEKSLDRETEDFELEVSSPGLDKPLKMPVQYKRNIGREVEVVKNDGTIVKGVISSAGEKNFEVEYRVKEKIEGTNKKQYNIKKETLDFDNIKSTRVIVKF